MVAWAQSNAVDALKWYLKHLLKKDETMDIRREKMHTCFTHPKYPVEVRLNFYWKQQQQYDEIFGNFTYLIANISWKGDFFRMTRACILSRRNGITLRSQISRELNKFRIMGKAVLASQWNAYSCCCTSRKPSWLFRKYELPFKLTFCAMKDRNSMSCVSWSQIDYILLQIMFAIHENEEKAREKWDVYIQKAVHVGNVFKSDFQLALLQILNRLDFIFWTWFHQVRYQCRRVAVYYN